MTVRTVCPLLGRSLRHFVFNRQSRERPWRIPLAFVYWTAGFPLALGKRLSGARLLRPAVFQQLVSGSKSADK